MQRTRTWTLGLLLMLGTAAKIEPPSAHHPGAALPELDHASAYVAAPSSVGPARLGEIAMPFRLALSDARRPAESGPLLLVEADERDSNGLRAIRIVEPGRSGSAEREGALVDPLPSTAGLTAAAALAFVALRRRV